MKDQLKESSVRKLLFNEISFLVAGIGLVSSVMFWVMNPQQQNEIEIAKLKVQLESTTTITASLDKIRNNDLNEIQIKLQNLEDRQIEILKALARLEALQAQ